MEYSYRLVIDSVIRNVRVVGCVTQFQRKFVELYTFLNTTLFITDTLKQTLVYNGDMSIAEIILTSSTKYGTTELKIALFDSVIFL